VQVDETVFQSIVDNKGVMQPFQFDNDSLAHHVEEMLSLERSPTVELSISVMPYLPSFPSILVIDDRFVFFSVPTGLTGRNEILKYGSVRTNFDVVFGIEDVSGEIPILFRQIIMQLKRSAKKVVKVDNNSVDT
jgi:hypothetical protein